MLFFIKSSYHVCPVINKSDYLSYAQFYFSVEFEGFNFVNTIERLTTIIVIIKSTVISNRPLPSNNPTRPNIQIAIKRIGNIYLIMKIHFLPTLIVENSFK